MSNIYLLNQNGLQTTNDRFVTTKTQVKTHQIEGFDQYVTQAHAIQEKCQDINVLGTDLRPYLSEEGIRVNVGSESYRLTEWSLNQLSSKVGVPSAYAMKMAEARKHQLFVDNFNSWIDSHVAGKKFLVRTYDDTIRGVLGDTYFPTDTDYVLPIFQGGLQQTGMNFMVHKGIINPEYTNIRVVSDHEIKVGDDPHYVGMSLSTSDVGRASLKMEFFIFRSRCTNGMLFGKQGGILFKKKHTSKHLTNQETFHKELVAGLQELPQLVAYAEHMLKEASRIELKEGEIDRIIEQYRKYSGAGVKEAEALTGMVQQFMPIYDNVKPTLWSLSNAFTEVAQMYAVDKAEAMESFAGHLLTSRVKAA